MFRQMEKLLRDLNIYAHSFMNCNLTFTHDGNRIRVQGDEIGPYVAESIILNKKFGFIKWLVENEKIDLGKIKKLYRKSNENSIHTYPIMYEYSDLESLLMLLSIQDEPIEFLVSILK